MNSKYLLRSNNYKTVNHIINKCNKLAQEVYKTVKNWVWRMIHLELCKKQKFDNITKWYIHKTESVLDDDMDFKIQKIENNTLILIIVCAPEMTPKSPEKRLASEICGYTSVKEHQLKQVEKTCI